MTVLAGAFSLLAGRPVPPALKESLKIGLCRRAAASGIDVFDRDGLFLIKWDSGVFGEKAWLERADGGIGALVGDPLLTSYGAGLSRARQLELLDGALRNDERALLQQTRGSFSCVSFDAESRVLHIVTDAIGLRAVYFAEHDGLFLFSTALRVLEALRQLPKKLSREGAAEQSVFTFPLADRTPYDGIRLMREAEILNVRSVGIDHRQYYNWSAGAVFEGNEIDAAQALKASFDEAVRVRLQPEELRVNAFLSGGLDSRAIVASLIEQCRSVEAMNFSLPSSQDLHYARMFADKTDGACRLHCLPWGGAYPNFSVLALKGLQSLEQEFGDLGVQRPRFVWSGDGGSVGLGHVYMDQKMLDLCRPDSLEDVARHFLEFNRNQVPVGILAARARREIPELILKNTLAEINRYAHEDLGRRVYLFLLFNDQRRHLSKHFESVDEHGLELLTPFYDTAFLKLIVSTPSRWGILHRLYSHWFELMPEFARSTPWQVYPGHVPCPVQSTKELRYQWSRDGAGKRAPLGERAALARFLLGIANSRKLPEDVFSIGKVRLAALLHWAGVKNFDYIRHYLESYLDMQQRCLDGGAAGESASRVPRQGR